MPAYSFTFSFLAMQSVDIPSKCIHFKYSHEGSNNTQENHIRVHYETNWGYIQIYSKSRWDLRIHVINVIITSFVTKDICHMTSVSVMNWDIKKYAVRWEAVVLMVRFPSLFNDKEMLLRVRNVWVIF